VLAEHICCTVTAAAPQGDHAMASMMACLYWRGVCKEQSCTQISATFGGVLLKSCSWSTTSCGAFKPAVFSTCSKPLSHWACTNVQRNKITMSLTRLSQNWYLRTHGLSLGLAGLCRHMVAPATPDIALKDGQALLWLCLLPADHGLRSFACQRPTVFRCPFAAFLTSDQPRCALDS
jgi:hypothetical protein